MIARLSLVLALLPALIGCASNANGESERKKSVLAEIEERCGVSSGTLRLNDDEQLVVKLSPQEKYERVDCAFRELKMSEFGADMKIGFVGNEMHPREEQK